MNNNGILWDCHMHSSFSGDSRTSAEEMILQGIRCGLKGICFTEHLDPDYPPTPDGIDFSLDIPSYQETLFSLKEKYQDRISLRFGIELGLQPHLAQRFSTLLHQIPFDFVIGSSHLVHGQDPYYPQFFQDRQEAQAYEEYFESILENLHAFSLMDVYGHLDYIVRYGPNQNREYSYQKYQDILDEILKTLIQKQVGIELNTGGYHYGLSQPNPCIEILKRYHELGGELITIGADAHTPDKIAYAFSQAEEVLKECGFSYYTVFTNRTPSFFKFT